MTTATDTTACYIARASCRCVRAACVADPEHRSETAKALAEWVLEGLTVERVTVAEAAQFIGVCPHRGTQGRLV